MLVVLPDQNAGGGVRITRGNYPGVGIWRAASHLTDRNDELFDIGLRLGGEPEQREQDETKGRTSYIRSCREYTLKEDVIFSF